MKINNTFFRGFVLYMFLWLILAERISIQVILIGTFITASVALFNIDVKNECFRGKRYQFIKKSKFIVSYMFLLIKEIVLASIEVAKIVLSREININPRVIKFKTKLKRDLSKTILANSITLTPGTLTIEVKDDEFTVHCISKNQIDDVMNSKFEELLLKIEEQ